MTVSTAVKAVKIGTIVLCGFGASAWFNDKMEQYDERHQEDFTHDSKVVRVISRGYEVAYGTMMYGAATALGTAAYLTLCVAMGINPSFTK